MAGGVGSGNSWIWALVLGGIGVGAGVGMEHFHVGPHWLVGTLLALGGLAVIFGACESMIKAVEGAAALLGWDEFVGGTVAGIASNIPELVMLGFIVAREPRVAFILVALTLHIGALAFGTYCGLLPRGPSGKASMPEPLVKLSTDEYAIAGVVLLATGMLMLALKLFGGETGHIQALYATDLYLIGTALLTVKIVAVYRLITLFSGETSAEATAHDGGVESVDVPSETSREAPSQEGQPDATIGGIVGYTLLGVGTSVVGGHAVGDFAEMLVGSLRAAGYSEMVGALILSFFACSGIFVMIITAHLKGMHNLAVANVSSAVTQVPYIVLPVVLIMHAAFAQTGIVPMLDGGGVLPIDVDTTAVVLLGFPPMLILYKAISDDGKVNWVETVGMTAVFVLVLYFLGVHG